MSTEELRKAVERDPNPLATGPTKWRAEHCVTHHHACDCREWEHACELHKWQGIAELSHGEFAERLERAEALLRDQEAENAAQATELRTLRGEYAKEFKRAEKAEALLRECVENREGLAYETDLLARITAHLGAEQ